MEIYYINNCKFGLKKVKNLQIQDLCGIINDRVINCFFTEKKSNKNIMVNSFLLVLTAITLFTR